MPRATDRALAACARCFPASARGSGSEDRPRAAAQAAATLARGRFVVRGQSLHELLPVSYRNNHAPAPCRLTSSAPPRGRSRLNNRASEDNMKFTTTARRVSIALTAVAAVAGSVTAFADDDDQQEASKAVAQLYELQAAFHEAAGGAGADATTKAQHLREMLDLWTDDAVLIVGTTVYAGLGHPNTSTCAAGSLTICDFFQNHAGSFVLGRNWAALTTLAA